MPLPPDADPAYLTMWLQLLEPLGNPLAVVTPLVAQAVADFGIRRIDTITASRDEATLAEYSKVSVPLDPRFLAGARRSKRMPTQVMYETSRRGAEWRIEDYLLSAHYLAAPTEAGDPSERRGPLVDISVRIDRDAPAAPSVHAAASRLAAAAASALPIVSGVVDIFYGVESCEGRYYSQPLGGRTTFDRVLDWAKWTAPECNQRETVFRLGWKTIIGASLGARLGDVAMAGREFCDATHPEHDPRSDWAQSVDLLADGSVVFTICQDPFRFLPGGGPFDYDTDVHGRLLYPAAWLHWRLRKAGLML